MSDEIELAVERSLNNQALASRFGFSEAVGTNPDKYAEAQRLAKEVNVPVDTAQNMPEEIKKRAAIESIDFDNLAVSSPSTAALLADIQKAKIAHDDVGNMSMIERTLQELGKGAKYVFSHPDNKNTLPGDLLGGAYMANRGIAGVLQAAFEAPAPLIDPLVGKIFPDNPLRRVAAGFAEIAKDSKKWEDWASPPDSTIVGGGVSSGVKSFSQNMLTLPIALLPGGAPVALGSMVGMTGGNAYADAREKGLSPAVAGPFAASQAIIEYATEKIPMSRLIGDIAKNAGLRQILVRQLASEIPGEQVATLLQDLNEWAVLHPEKPFKSYLDERPSAAAQTLIATVVGVGGNVALMKTLDTALVSTLNNNDKVRTAESSAPYLKQLDELAKASKVRARDTDTFETFVNMATEGSPITDVYIDAKILDQSGIAEQLAAVSPSVAEQFQVALETGNEIRIPVAEYTARIAGTELNQGLLEHLKTEPEGFSKAEAQAYMQSFAEDLKADIERTLALKQGDEAFKTQIESVKTNIKSQLDTAARFTSEVNDAYATMVSNFYGVMAGKLGINPDELLARYPVRIQAQSLAGGQQFDQGPFGPRFDQFKGDAQGAIEHLKAQKTGEAIGALHHPELGDIDLVWGEEGTSQSDGYGLSKLIKFHPEVVDNLQGILSDMKVVFKSDTRAQLESKDHRAGVRLQWDGKAKQWLLTAFRKNGAGEGTRTDTAKFTSADDTASRTTDPEDIVDQKINQYYQSLNQSDRNLIVTHNLTADNLLHSLKIGGIPVPSLAITNKDTPLSGFGEITLIGSEAMADPKGYAGTKVFGADIYSPRYPSVEYVIASKTLVKAQRELRGAEDATGERLDWDEVRRQGVGALENSAPMMWRFLTQNGITPEIVLNEVKPLPAALGGFSNDTRLKHDLVADPAFIEAAAQAYYDEVILKLNDGDVVAAQAELAELKANEDQLSRLVRGYADDVSRFQRDTRDAGKPDSYATKRAMRSQIETLLLDQQFNEANREYLASLNPDEKIFQGFTYSGNRKYIPHTLENVVKLLKKELRGGENFNYGVGSLRAKFTPQFKSVDQIRKSKHRLVSDAEFKKIKDEIDDQFWEVARSIDQSLSGDTAVAILEDSAKMGVKRAAKEYGYEIDDDTAVKAAEFLTRLRELPTQYFEAKVLREVDLSEFSGAVVPDNVNPKVIEALQARGVKDIRTYKLHDEADRAAKVGEFEHLFFQDKGDARGSFNPATNTITLLKNADLSTFLHESGHFFLETQFDIAARIAQEYEAFGPDASQPGQKQILEDTNTILTWFGITDLNEWNSLDFEEKRSYHEKFARGFEAYLFEGKAPSIEVQGVFQRFRAWLLNVYKELKNLNVELTDEVRGVFDRMLATNDQIELAEQGRSMMELFTSANQAGMTVEEFAAYQALGVDATNDAIQDLQARGLRDLAWARNARGREIKKLQKQAAARRAEVTMEVRREVMSQPIYRAWQFLTSKLTADDKITPAELPKSNPDVLDETIDSLFTAIAKLGGLDRAQVEKQWGFDPKERSPMPAFGKYTLKRDGGLSIDAMGEALAERGYLSLDENGRFDQRELEEKFDAEMRGDIQYSTSVDERILRGLGKAGEDLNVDALGAGRFDASELRSMGLPENIIEIITSLKMTAKNGLHPDIVAEMFGFTSGDELVRRLAIAQAPKQEINDLTDTRMLELYGELATPEAIEREADKAIHNENRARVVATEANALAKATGQRKVLLPAAKEFARAMIAKLKIRDIRPGQYAAAEVRAAKAAEKASKAGDLATAAAEKRNQLVNTYATKAAYDAQDEIESGVRYLKKFDNEGTRKNLDSDYLDQIDALLERFDLRKLTNKAMDKRTALAAWLKSQEDQGLVPEIPEDLQNEAFRKPYKEMTVEELRGLIDSVKQIEHLGRLKNRLLTAANNRAFEAVRDEIADSIEENAGDRQADTRTPTTNLGRALASMKNFYASHIKAATWARIMDGGKDGGAVWEYFVRPANERGDMETTMRADATKRLSEILTPVFKLGKMGGKGVFFPTINRSLNRESRLAIALNMGNEGNIQRLLGGEGWTIAQIRPVLESLTAAEWTAVQEIWDHFETYRPQIAAKEKRVYGKEPDWVEPSGFQVKTADGQTVDMRGGYYPIKYDPAASQRAEEYADAEGAKRQLQGAFTSATTRRSFTKARSEEIVGRPLLYTLAGLYSGVNDVIHDLAWHEWLIDANRLLRSQKIDSAMRERYGPQVKAQFKTWSNDIAEGDKGAANAGEMALARLRQGVSAAGLGFNVMSAAMQVLGFTQSIVRIGPTWVGRGITQFVASPIDSTREVNAKSEFMANRSRTLFRELNELRNKVQDESVLGSAVKQGAFYLMMRAQQMVDVPSWLGAYNKAIAAGNSEERSIQLADQAVIDAQGGGQLKDLSAIERGGPALKLFTVFYSFMNTAFNLGVTQTMTANTPAKKAKLVADYLLLYTVPPVLGYFLKEALTPGGGDDDWEKLSKKLAAEQLSYLMGMMVVVREFGEAAKIVTGAEGARGYQGPAGVRFIADSLAFGKQAKQGDFDEAFRKSAINLIGDFSGLPAAQVNRTITGVQALSEGKTKNPAAVMFGFDRK